MSPRGWPKGKPRPRPLSEKRIAADKKFIAAGQRALRLKKVRAAEMTSGLPLGGGLNTEAHPHRPTGGSPAMWLPITKHIGDCEYLEDGLDDVLLRALDERVVYAHRPESQREPPFQDVTLATIAAVELHARKLEKSGRDPRKPYLPLPSVRHMRKLPLTSKQVEIVGMIAAGLSTTQIATELGISPRTAKAHCDSIRAKLGVERLREIPAAYRLQTGKDPFTLAKVVESEEKPFRAGKPLPAVVVELMTSSHKPGRSLLEVVAELMDDEPGRRTE